MNYQLNLIFNNYLSREPAIVSQWTILQGGFHTMSGEAEDISGISSRPGK
jgi:hypothetical protein